MATASTQARRARSARIGSAGASRARSTLREHLEARREEIEAAALTRVRAISDPSEVSDPTYVEGLRAAVAGAVAYGIETTGREGPDPPIPVTLLAQARMAARVGIPLDTVLRRYFAGYSLLGYFVLEEATRAGIADGVELQHLLGAHAGIFDRLLAAVSEEHARESEAIAQSSGNRDQAERVERLLAGEPVDTAEIPYDFEGWHVGLTLSRPGEAMTILRELTPTFDCHLLAVRREEGSLWAWLGARRRLEPVELIETLHARLPVGCAGALGESGEGPAGWRLTHRQAVAASSVGARVGERIVRYVDVALLASALRDDLLTESLRRLYLAPLDEERDGAALRETLRAYLEAGGSLSGAASKLGVSRHTISNRLQRIEARLGRPVYVSLAEIDAALRLELLSPAGTTTGLANAPGSN